jgi:FtsP/CotA-like multicopper oxidase with cupredoxin domain
MYHSHHNATVQVGQGMLGPLLVMPNDTSVDPVYDKDELFIFNDSLGGLTINGKGYPATAPYTAKLGERVRLRFMNEGQMTHAVHLHGLTFEVFARDGYRCQQRSSATRSTSHQVSAGMRSLSPTLPRRGRSTATSLVTRKARPVCSGWSPLSSSRRIHAPP